MPDRDPLSSPASSPQGDDSPKTFRRTEIARPDLIRKFRDASQSALVVLRDIAGSGKTMAARQWAGECRARGDLLGWVSLEPDDNDLNTFLIKLIEALTTAGLPMDIEMSILVRSSPVSPFRLVLDTLLDAIVDVPTRATIILDDLQTVTTQEVKEALNRLVEHAPPNLQIVVTTREAPPFRMSRLRAQGRVFEFPPAALRFSMEETRSFFINELGDAALSTQQLEQTLSVTRGWPVALQFMVMAAKQSGEHEVKLLSHGSANGLYTFLREDVLAPLPDECRRFLVSCAILQELNAGICDVILDASGSADMLEWLERRNFTVRDNQENYRFCHPLLLEFLRDQQKTMDRKEIAKLHERAAEYFHARQNYLNAIEHAIKAGAYDRAAEILEMEGMILVRASRIQELKAWLEIVPEAVIAQNRRLELFWVWILFHIPQPRKALRKMVKLLRSIRSGVLTEASFGMSAEDLDAELRVLSAGVLSANGRSALARQTALASMKALRNRSGFNKGTLCNILSYSEVILGDVTAARSASRLGLENHKRANSVFGITYSELLTAVAEIEIGEPFKAEHTLRRGRDFVVASIGRDSYAEALLSIAECEVRYWWNQCDSAHALLEPRLPLVEQSGTLLFILNGGLLRAKLAAARGRPQHALQLLDALDAGDSRRFPMTMRHCILDEKVRLLLLSDDLISAKVAIRSAGLNPDHPAIPDAENLSIGMIAGHMAMARLYIVEGRFNEALQILKALEADAVERERNRSLLSIRGLMAIALWKGGAHLEATDIVLSAMKELAEKSVVRTFLDLGPDMLDPLKSAAEKARLIDRKVDIIAYCNSIICALEAEYAQGPSGQAASLPMTGDYDDVDLIEPLTEREHEIARLLANGMTNSQISKALAVSVDTVKWHLKNLFQKLGVSNRTQAVIALTGQKSFLIDDN
ncbi:LuxR C-terminal-related transcriptional regulator [Roseovarius sp. 2305UL8-3]|uniref:LuxR C-terminal-related transcriptional regulator n=1 Tax=Roseovarius conchicola TaxID=3121636 RepID=UPI0035296D5D